MSFQVVKRGYNTVADTYLAERPMLKSGKYVQKLLKLLRPHSSLLDLGCGAGVPVDDLLIKTGHDVLGIDVSEVMIERARQQVKGATYLVGSIADLTDRAYQVDAIVSFYTLFHLPRDTHGRLLKLIASFLPKNGLLLITMGDKEYEGTINFYGTPMWFSQWGPKKNRELMIQAGFEILLDEIDHSGAEHHQVLLARKI